MGPTAQAQTPDALNFFKNFFLTGDYVVAGIGLSIAGMVAAANNYLTPVQGALLQEAIDVMVILNALRALRISPSIGSISATQEGAPVAFPSQAES